jgi:hypothetical protein
VRGPSGAGIFQDPVLILESTRIAIQVHAYALELHDRVVSCQRVLV